MKVNLAADREWTNAGYPNAERAILHLSPAQGRTSIVRLKAGARGPRHRHQAGEHAFLISGKVQIDNVVLGPGDYLYAEPGEEHALLALEDSVLFASTEKPIVVVEKDANAA
jgi:quercetin dioxygenase-like cupin family protein